MRVLRRIGISVLLILSLAAGLCFGQHTADQIYAKGMEYAAEGKFEEAKEKFEKALKVDPFYISAKMALKIIEDGNKQKIKGKTVIYIFEGIAHSNKKRWDEAIDEYNKGIEINPKYPEAYNTRGAAYDDKGEYDKAISDYTKAIEINPSFADAYQNRGIAYDDKGQCDKAISDYTKAIEINPGDAGAYYNRGFTYIVNLGDKEKGCPDLQRACELGECRNYELAKGEGLCE